MTTSTERSKDEQSIYLTEEYVSSLSELVESSSERDVSKEAAREFYLQECEKFSDVFTDETPLSAVRKIAFRQTKYHLLDE